MTFPTAAAMTTRRSSLGETLAAGIGLLSVRSLRPRALVHWNEPAGRSTLPRLPVPGHYATEPASRPKRPILWVLTPGSGLRLLLLVLGLELGDDRRIGQSRRVAQGPALGDVAQEPAHDLAAARLGELGREDDVVGPRQGPDLLRDVGLELVHERGRAVHPALHRDERGDRLPLDVVALADDRRFGH